MLYTAPGVHLWWCCCLCSGTCQYFKGWYRTLHFSYDKCWLQINLIIFSPPKLKLLLLKTCLTCYVRAELTPAWGRDHWVALTQVTQPNPRELSLTSSASNHCRWKSHKWRKCQLVPWFLRQSNPGAQETCGPGIQTRGRRHANLQLLLPGV